jgi:hypothetical protein
VEVEEYSLLGLLYYDYSISVYIGIYRYISAYVEPLPTYIGDFALQNTLY